VFWPGGDLAHVASAVLCLAAFSCHFHGHWFKLARPAGWARAGRRGAATHSALYIVGMSEGGIFHRAAILLEVFL
jgi:hypothetical protein